MGWRTLRPLSRHLGLTALPRLRCTPGETSIQDWRASYGNMDLVSFPLWTTAMAGHSGQMSHCSGFQPLVYILFVCSLADCYFGFGCSRVLGILVAPRSSTFWDVLDGISTSTSSYLVNKSCLTLL